MQSFEKLIGYLKAKIQSHSDKPMENQKLLEMAPALPENDEPKIILKLRELVDGETDPEKGIHICPECGGELYVSHIANNSLSGQRWGIGIQCKNCKVAAHMSLAGDFIPKWLEKNNQ